MRRAGANRRTGAEQLYEQEARMGAMVIKGVRGRRGALNAFPRFLEAFRTWPWWRTGQNRYHWDALGKLARHRRRASDELLGSTTAWSAPNGPWLTGRPARRHPVFKGPHRRCFGSREEIVEEETGQDGRSTR